MDHAAKMILVPADTAIGTSAMTAGNIDKSLPCDGDMLKKTKTVQTPGTFESRFDADMADILQSDKEEFERSIVQADLSEFFTTQSKHERGTKFESRKVAARGRGDGGSAKF